MKGRRGVRRLAMVVVVLSCLVPAGAHGQTSGFLTTTSTTAVGDRASDIARAIAGLEREPTTTTTTAGDLSHATGVGPVAAAVQGGTTTTTAPLVTSSEIDAAALAPGGPATIEPAQRPSPSLDQGAPAPRAELTGTAAFAPPVESPIEGTATTGIASPPSIVIADSEQVALAEASGGPVRLPVGSNTQLLAPSMLLFALVLLVAPSVIEARRRKRR